ncbi:thioredoxin family protein [Candidatus Sumerlaeota bacterium]|nr:thioredoxin family protein [Candidatus Sumerlaeota bacterium]
MTLTRLRWIVAIVCVLLSARSEAELLQPVSWSFALDPPKARAGEAVTLQLTATPQEPWHFYAHTLTVAGPVPTQFTFDLPPGLRAIGGIEAPAPKKKLDEGFGKEVEIYHSAVTFRQKIAVGDGVTSSQAQIKGTVQFQACDSARCLPPRTEAFDLALAIESGPPREQYHAVAAAITQPASGSLSSQAIGDAMASGFLAFLLLAIGQGLLALTTPCVYPMIPITISYFLKQGEREGRKPVLLAVAYAASIIVTFTSLGVLLTLLYGPAGMSRLGSSPIANLVLGLLFVAFALSLFGLYEITIPASVQSYFAGKGRGGGYVGAIFMGVAFTLASLACTAPFVGAVLGLATTGERVWPLIGMLAFSCAFAFPLFLLAVFPQFLARMPKSGGWLNSVKVVMGFVVLAVALKFLANSDAVWNWQILTRSAVLAAWATIAAFAGFYLLGMIRLPHDSPIGQVGVWRMLVSMLFLALGLYFAAGLFGQRLYGGLEAFLPAEADWQLSVSRGATEEAALGWLGDYEQAVEQAKKEQKPILIDFTGVTCTNCKWMERNIHPRPEVVRTMERFVLVQLYTDSGPKREANARMQVDRFGTAALPLYVIMGADDRELARLEGLTRDPVRFVAFLEEGFAALGKRESLSTK